MKLKPVIASYFGETRSKAVHALNDKLLAIVAQLTQAPIAVYSLDQEMLQELEAMHVVKLEGGIVRLNTAVFLAEDIIQVVDVASMLGRGLAEGLLPVSNTLPPSSPEIRNLLAGVVGVGQGVSKLLREEKLVVDWKNYTGDYASTKVDFDEICAEADLLGPDLQNKCVTRGTKYTAVFIGPTERINTRFTPQQADTYGDLLMGEISNDGLVRTAEEVGLFSYDKPRRIVVTRAVYEAYIPVIARLTEISFGFYTEHMGVIRECLATTSAGRQGVPLENMMMHFWRYCRRALARELYSAEFFTDDVATRGIITVFYDNEIEELSRLL